MEKSDISLEKLKELENQTKDKFTKLLIDNLRKKINSDKRNEFYELLDYNRIINLTEHEEENNKLSEFKKIKHKDIAYTFSVFRDSRKKDITLNGEFPLETLSNIIQKEFDLEPMHLYEFEIGDHKFGPECDEWQEIFDSLDDFKIGAAISAAGLKKGDSFKFLYDFGDKIKFKIKIIRIEKLDLNVFKNGKHRQKPCR